VLFIIYLACLNFNSHSKSLHCHRCKSLHSWMWKKLPSGGFVCTICENKEQDGDDIVAIPRRTHRDSLVVLEGDHMETLEVKPSVDMAGKGDVVLEIDSGTIAEATSGTPLPTRKSSRSTRSTISNTNPYAYPRPVMSKPKEKKSIVKAAVINKFLFKANY